MGVAYLRVALIKQEHIASINIRILPDDTQNIIDSTINLIRREINKVGRKVENQMEKIFTFLCRFLSLRAFIDLFLKRGAVRLVVPGRSVCVTFFATGIIFQFDEPLSYRFDLFQSCFFVFCSFPAFCSCL